MIPVTHEIKIFKGYADAIISGKKTFEIRLNDRHYMLGDKIHFYEITYILYGNTLGFGGLKEDWCIFAIKESEVTNDI